MRQGSASRALKIIVLAVLGVGCQSAKLPNPNTVDESGLLSGEALNRMIADLFSTMDHRVEKGEISSDQRDSLISTYLSKKLAKVNPNTIPAEDAWIYGDAYRLTGKWETAKTLYAVAVKVARTQDRLVNDSLRLARAQAATGDADKAVETARSTFAVRPREKAPILLGVLYELTPLLRGQITDKELAQLILDAAGQHEQTVVDPTTTAGRDFMIARKAHLRNALNEAELLLRSAGDSAAADQVKQRRQRTMQNSATL